MQEPRDGGRRWRISRPGWRWRSQEMEVGDGGAKGRRSEMEDLQARSEMEEPRDGGWRWRISRPGWRWRSQEMEDLQARSEMEVRDGGAKRWRSEMEDLQARLEMQEPRDGGSPGQVGDAGGKRRRLEMEEPGRQRAELEILQLHWPPRLRQPRRRQEPALCSSPATFGYLQTALPRGSPGRGPTCAAVV